MADALWIKLPNLVAEIHEIKRRGYVQCLQPATDLSPRGGGPCLASMNAGSAGLRSRVEPEQNHNACAMMSSPLVGNPSPVICVDNDTDFQ
jgi:hypothetical protein